MEWRGTSYSILKNACESFLNSELGEREHLLYVSEGAVRPCRACRIKIRSSQVILTRAFALAVLCTRWKDSNSIISVTVYCNSVLPWPSQVQQKIHFGAVLQSFLQCCAVWKMCSQWNNSFKQKKKMLPGWITMSEVLWGWRIRGGRQECGTASQLSDRSARGFLWHSMLRHHKWLSRLALECPLRVLKHKHV